MLRWLDIGDHQQDLMNRTLSWQQPIPPSADTASPQPAEGPPQNVHWTKNWPDRIRVGWRWLASSDGRAANTTHPHGHVHARDGQGLHKKNDEGTTWTRVLFVGWRHSSRWSYIVGEWLSLSSVKKRMQVQWCDSLGSNYVVFLVYLASKYIKHGSWNCSFYHLSRRNTIF